MNLEQPCIRISVRNLVEFILRHGDIDNRTGGADKEAMQQGGRIHRKIQRQQGAEYRAEVPLKYQIACDGFILSVEGRADGIIELPKRVVIEKIGTHLARRGAAPGEGAARRWDDYSAPARPVPGHCLARSATTRHDAKIQPEVVGVFTRLLPREAQTGALRAAYARTQEAARIRAWPPGRGRKGEAWARQRTRPSTRRPAGAGSAPEATRPRWT